MKRDLDQTTQSDQPRTHLRAGFRRSINPTKKPAAATTEVTAAAD
jgi:hypothetical protein